MRVLSLIFCFFSLIPFPLQASGSGKQECLLLSAAWLGEYNVICLRDASIGDRTEVLIGSGGKKIVIDEQGNESPIFLGVKVKTAGYSSEIIRENDKVTSITKAENIFIQADDIQDF